MKTAYTEIHDHRVDLFLRREYLARTWPNGEISQWERFSFPLRCLDEVHALAEECAQTTERDALELVRKRRRAIQWAESP
jgi:hypothetical protein